MVKNHGSAGEFEWLMVLVKTLMLTNSAKEWLMVTANEWLMLINDA